MEPLYLGFDLSTQQLKGLAVTPQLKVVYETKFDFDADSSGFDVKNGVLTNEAEHEVFAPVAMWLQALDTVLGKLKESGLDFSRVKGISGAGQQHGSVYWNMDSEAVLSSLDGSRTLQQQLAGALAHPYSPNWQDASTQKECDQFDAALGSGNALAQVTGSKAHHVRPISAIYPQQADVNSAVHRSPDFTFPTQIPRRIRKDLPDLTRFVLLSFCVLGKDCSFRYL